MRPPVTRFESHIRPATGKNTAVEVLSAETDLSRTRIKQIMQLGAVWLTREQHTQRLRRASKLLHLGDELHLYYDDKVLNYHPPPAQLIADEREYSVWLKPYGMWSQGSRWGDHSSITRWAELHLQRPAFLVHRLDRAANGVMLLAHSKRMANRLAELFRQREVEKRYRVLVEGKFPPKPNPYVIKTELDNKYACSRVNRLKYDPVTERSLLDVAIETGRKHQIRRHLAGMGFPVFGDRLYGSTELEQDLQLSACYLGFVCPNTKRRKSYLAPASQLPSL